MSNHNNEKKGITAVVPEYKDIKMEDILYIGIGAAGNKAVARAIETGVVDQRDVLGFSYCADEELPENEQVLKLIRAVRKGKLDLYTLLHKFGRGEMKQMLNWL